MKHYQPLGVNAVEQQYYWSRGRAGDNTAGKKKVIIIQFSCSQQMLDPPTALRGGRARNEHNVGCRKLMWRAMAQS